MGEADRVATRCQPLEELQRRCIVAALIGGGRVLGLTRNSRACPRHANNGERDYRPSHRLPAPVAGIKTHADPPPHDISFRVKRSIKTVIELQ
jgi:hypothetical protein